MAAFFWDKINSIVVQPFSLEFFDLKNSDFSNKHSTEVVNFLI